MNDSIRDILVVSDMDGTLLADDCTIPACNLQTIRLFTMLGGKFTVATGRTVSSIEIYPELTGLIVPAITTGGGVIYDFKEKKPVKSATLPYLAARQALRDVLHKFPGVGIIVMGANTRLYQVRPSPQLSQLIADERMEYFHRPYEDLPDEWNKVLFAADPDSLRRVSEYVSTRTYPGVYFLSTNTRYLEIMPSGVSKASALAQLCDIVGVDIENTYALGDYYNDLDLMKKAGHAIAMGNAPGEVKALADEVAGTNNEGGVGQFLYCLMKNYEC